ncbi:MAG TPA: hypothetical protein VGM50_17010 [Gemmatimonadaceae bacterium]|jgi:hypothetical protein
MIILRRFRSALVLGSLWALLAAGVGLFVGIGLAAAKSPYPVLSDVSQWWFESRDVVLAMLVRWGIAGGALGLMFAGVLVQAERGSEGGRLSSARAAAWGGIAGVGFVLIGLLRVELSRRASGTSPLGSFPYVMLPVTAVIGATFGWLTVRWARRGDAAHCSVEANTDVLRSGGVLPASDVAERSTRRRAPVA